MIKYYLILSLSLCVSEMYTLNGMNSTIEETKSILKYCCNYCCKQEVTSTFKHCKKCGVTRYCSTDCQCADWPVHKTQCPQIDVEQQNKTIAQTRESIMQQFKDMSEKWINEGKTMRITAQDQALINDNTNILGVAVYKILLLEECIAAQKKGEVDLVEKYMSYFPFVAKREEGINADLLTVQQQSLLPAISRTGRYLEYDKHEFVENITTALQDLEITKARGTRFLNKGYSPHIENTLEILRRKIAATWVAAGDGKSIDIVQHITLFFVYTTLCDIPCLLLQKEQDFVQGVAREDHILLLSCLAWDRIIEKELENPSFIAAEEKEYMTLASARCYLELWKSKRLVISPMLAETLCNTSQGKNLPLHCLLLIKKVIDGSNS